MLTNPGDDGEMAAGAQMRGAAPPEMVVGVGELLSGLPLREVKARQLHGDYRTFVDSNCAFGVCRERTCSASAAATRIR